MTAEEKSSGDMPEVRMLRIHGVHSPEGAEIAFYRQRAHLGTRKSLELLLLALLGLFCAFADFARGTGTFPFLTALGLLIFLIVFLKLILILHLFFFGFLQGSLMRSHNRVLLLVPISRILRNLVRFLEVSALLVRV